jgi:copper resistance protein C
MTTRPATAMRPAVSPALAVAALTAGLVLALAMLLATAGAAQAHARFLASNPANGAKLTAAPPSVKLTFNEDMLPGSAKVRLDGPAGVATVGDIVVKATTVVAAMPPDLSSGTYTVTWRVTSADGHPISGAFRFTLTLPAAATTTAAASAVPTTTSASPSIDTIPVTPTASTTDGGATPLVVGALAATLLVAGGLWWWRSRS